MSKRQNAGKYIAMAFYSCQAIQDALGRSPHSATLSLSRSRPQTHILTSTPPTSVQSYQIRIKARATTPSRRNTIFLLVSGMCNPRNLRNFKRVAPLRLSACCGAPSLDISHLRACLDLNTEKPPRRVTKSMCCDWMDSASRL